jgi:hypothetical protein
MENSPANHKWAGFEMNIVGLFGYFTTLYLLLRSWSVASYYMIW